ncbi:InlB B-repeat-containing protein, partial [Prevotellamassilia timonensis]|uniref:InlB B-repeat-containing protein n=1 Tax=Prevotellamassilia timonensis TaxID=1852370 RepID=UPI0030797D46
MTHIHTKSLWLLIATLLLSVFGARAQNSGSEAPWTVNPHDYKYDMTLYANIVFDGTPITDFSHYQVGAFVGDECRGTAEVQTKDEAQWLYLRVRSNQPQGENIVLRLRDTDTGEVLNLQPESGDITFESQGLGGRPGSPLVLNAARSYALTYKVGGVEHYTEEVPYGTTLTPIEYPEREGHSFSGWTGLPLTMPAHDVEVTGEFVINQYTITFDANGGSEVAPITQDYNTAITAPDAPTREGYTFMGWNEELPATMPARDLTLTAQWQINTYNLIYNVDGMTYTMVPVTYGDAVTPEPAPTKEGHTFSGWSEIPATMPAHDVEVTGSFTVNTYKLVYKVDGEVYKTTEVTYGTAITPESAPEKEGHTFSGWSEIPATMPASDVEVTGSFTVNTYKLVYKVDGEVYKTIEVTYGTAPATEAAPEKEGHTFSGWSEIPATMPANDVEVTGSFTANTYKLVYKVDGEVYKTTEVTYGTAPATEAAPEKEGHTFS